MRAAIALFIAAVTVQPAFAAPARDATMAVLAGRLFPVLTSLAPAAGPAQVRAMLAERSRRIAACGQVPACRVNAAAWSEAEAQRLADMVVAAPTVRALPVRDREERRLAVRRELQGINLILQVYGAGAAPRYPEIDGPLAAAGTPRFDRDVLTAIALNDAGRDDPVTALDYSLGLALALLDVNGRLDAISFEPLDRGLNRAAFQRSASVDWSAYRHTAIIALGVGPDDLATPLSGLGKLNVRLAAQHYLAGDAPFIIVSGSSVHPRGTTRFEALEMRRALIERYNVPEDAIVLEPHARHTTTNLRNASRLLMAMHAPADKDALVVTNPQHSAYIEGEGFRTRNLKELGYEPGKVGKRVSSFAIGFRPSADSARIDPGDPLDP